MNTTNHPSATRDLLYRYLDFLLFAGLWLWLGIFQVAELKQGFWGAFINTLLITGVVQLPGLVFAWFKPRLKGTGQYSKAWIVCFLVALPAVTLCQLWLLPKPHDPFFIITAALSSFTLALLLIVNDYYRKQAKQIKWLKKIRLESAVLISLILIAVAISAMGVSSMGIPAYDKPNQLLIGYEFSPVKILTHWWTFLGFTAQFLFMYLMGYLFFFINSRVLVSRILKQKGLVMYILSVLVTMAFLYPVIGQLLTFLPINEVFGRSIFPDNPFSLENAFGVSGIMLISLPIVLALQWADQNTRIVSLEKEKAQTELDLLKQQLNPHFFFNTLNNLYALSLQRSDKTPESILQLSELMRYVIYKGQEERVDLAQEVKYIHDYVQLQQMRLINPLNFNFKQDITHNNPTIAPLLLIVLVENAFKHGIEPAENGATLKLYLKCTNNELYFSCDNSVEQFDTAKEKGIGLLNLTRRLELLYPGRYSFNTITENVIFKAELKLQLK